MPDITLPIRTERLGMGLEARLVDKWHYKGQWATELVYAILDKEWLAR